MAVIAKSGGIKSKTYLVAGKTLAEIDADVKKKGPTSGGKHVYGYTKTPVSMDPSKGKMSGKVKEKSGKFIAEIQFVKGTIVYSGEILMPNLRSDRDLSKKAKNEWKRFMGKLLAHENEHVAKAKSECEAIAAEINALKGIGKESTKDKAIAACKKDMAKQLKAKYSKAKLDERLKKMHVGFDKTSKHGANHGAILKTSII